jgi:hypothetical protein
VSEEIADDKVWRVPLSAFAKTLRPRVVKVPSTAVPGATRDALMPGSPDEIWLKWLLRVHGREKHTPDEWQALIDKYRDMPAVGV